MSFETITYALTGNVATIRLNRPDRMKQPEPGDAARIVGRAGPGLR